MLALAATSQSPDVSVSEVISPATLEDGKFPEALFVRYSPISPAATPAPVGSPLIATPVAEVALIRFVPFNVAAFVRHQASLSELSRPQDQELPEVTMDEKKASPADVPPTSVKIRASELAVFELFVDLFKTWAPELAMDWSHEAYATVFAPVMVSVPARCTTNESEAFAFNCV